MAQTRFGAEGNIETITYTIRVDTSAVIDGFNQLEQVVLRTLILTHQMGLPEDIESALLLIQRTIIAVKTLHLAYTALMASTPVTLPFAFVSFMLATPTIMEPVSTFLEAPR